MSSACVEAKRCHGDVTVIPHSPEKASADRSELVGRRRHSDRHDGPSPDQQESRGIGKRREGDDGIEVMATTRGVHGMNDTSVHEFSGHRGGDKHHERRQRPGTRMSTSTCQGGCGESHDRHNHTTATCNQPQRTTLTWR